VARRLLASVALLTLSALAVPAAAQAVSIDNGGRADRSVTQLQRGAATACRTPLRSVSGAAPEQCTPIDGRAISEARVDAYEQSWTHRALSLQRGLDQGVALAQAQMPHTHNSFNASSFTVGSTSYYPTLTNQDPNQVYSITDQLRMDVRAIEIDLHWVPSPYAAANGRTDTGGKWVTMCHGNNDTVKGVHVGCTWDRPFEDGLTEVRTWLDANPDQVILLYLENQLTDESGAYNPQAHEIAAGILSDELGSKVYRPPAGQACADMPLGVSRTDIRNAGAQVLIVGNCGAGGDWGTWVHERGPQPAHWDESGDPTTYGPSDCARDRAQRLAGAPFRRWYEDSTWLTAMLNGSNSHITPETTAQMVKCGVNIVGFDQLMPDDGRLSAFVWSWAPDEPKAGAGSCAYQGGDGRFRAGNCGDKKHFACIDPAGVWHVTSGTGKWDKVNTKCADEFPGSRFVVPANGLHNQLIAEAKRSPSDEVWLNYSASGGSWTPLLSS
jgi:hypothetical protein